MRLFSSHRSRVFSVAFSPDGNYIASSGEDKKIKLWDIRSGGLCKELKGHTDIVYALEFDNNSEVLCSGGMDKTVKLWNIHSKNVVIEPDFGLSSFKSSGCVLNNVQSTGCSSELMRSISLNFNVYSINVDVQNVFYFSGARKPSCQRMNNQRPIVSSVNQSQAAIPSLKKEPASNASKSTNQKINTAGSSSNNNTPSTRNRSKPATSTTPNLSINDETSPTPATDDNSSKSRINTRRRAAAATSTQQQVQQQQQQQQHPLPPNSTNYLLDNDDLYEV